MHHPASLLCIVLAASAALRGAEPAPAGWFHVFDATARRAVDLPYGRLDRSAGSATFDASNPELRLHATFAPNAAGYTLVRGEIENLRRDDRGFMVDYRLPRTGPAAVFTADLESSHPMAGRKDTESNVFPIAAMGGDGPGVALALPPTEPRDFGMLGGDEGLGVRFYLGVTSATRRFPNRASFVFLIFPIDGQWGFRSALSRYYGFFPDYYTPRLKKQGLFMFQMADRTPSNVDQYGFDLVESQFEGPVLDRAIARDQAHGITTFPYTIVGQREVKFLPALPATYEGGMAAFRRWTPAMQAGHPLTKENVTNGGDRYLKEEIESSACAYANGELAMVVRETKWGDKSVTFKTNPNPDLFSDQRRRTVGGLQLATDEQWLRQHPEFGGIFVDSLGANWPALFNYRREHFPYARYPLTFDADGRIALHNTTSHYEFITALRDRLRASGRLVMGNGVYAYVSKGRKPSAGLERQSFDGNANEFIRAAGPAEHSRGAGTKLGRFFITALLDAATCEAGIKATVEMSEDNRVMMGPKTYAYINYHWDDPAPVENLVNQSLAFGIYASTTTDYFRDIEYEDNPHGYLRDKPLLDWYVPLVNRLARAGWEPVRDAEIEGAGVFGERFGRGRTVYFTLYNDGSAAQRGSLAIDFAALGLPANAVCTEIARNAPLESDGHGGVGLLLAPHRTYVIQVSAP